MTNVPNSAFPTLGEIMDLARGIVNDTFPGINGEEGRILPNSSRFAIRYLNSAFRTVQRRLRNEGVTFPIKDYYILEALPPVPTPDPGKFCFVGFNGYFNGTQMFGNIRLPGDCMQVSAVRQRQTGTNLEFTPMLQAMEGLPSGYQNQWMEMWEWRGYAIWFNGCLNPTDLMIRYLTGQPPIQAPAADFDITPVYILDCQDAIAALVASLYGGARGGNDAQIAKADKIADDALDEMALEYVRRQQTVNYRRDSYQGGGSGNTGNTSLGSTGAVS